MKWSLKNNLSQEQDPRFVRILTVLILAGIVGFFIIFFFSLYYTDHKLLILTVISCATLTIPLIFLFRRNLFAGTWSFSLITILATTLIATIGQGSRDISLLAFPVILVFTSLALSRLILFINFGLILTSLAWLIFGEKLGWYVPVPNPLPVWADFVMVSFIFMVLLGTIDRLTENLRNNLNQARHEIAQRKKSEAENLKLQEQLAQKQKMDTIGQLAGGIAHDFNNQLTGILGYAELLTARLGDETLKQYVRNIQKGAENGAKLTQQLLSFARKGQYRLEMIDLNEIIDEVVSILDRTIDKQIQIRQVRNVPVPAIRGDRSQIQNAILNIALNARDAINGGGEITFESNLIEIDNIHINSLFNLDPGSYICISIRDNGCGMDEKVKNRLFEPFFTTKEIGKGTGMGLPSAYGAVKHHGGGLFVESIPQIGSTIHVLLPFIKSETDESPNGEEVPVMVKSAGILIIDDDEIICGLMSELLGSLGYKVYGEEDGETGLQFYREHWKEIDLVILDMIMPGMGGEEVFYALKEFNPQVKILLSSGYNHEEDSIARIVNQGTPFIQKPCSLNELHRAVKEIL